MNKSKISLSAVLITKNCADLLKKCLESISFADEIVIVDDYSTDGTYEIAKKFGAKVILRKFDEFGSQKQFAVDKATGNWILVIDSDEIVTLELQREIKNVLRKSNRYSAYRIPYQSYFLGHSIKHAIQEKRIQLFKKGKGHITDVSVHEKIVIPDGKVCDLEGKILHYSFRSISQVLIKMTKYAEIESDQLAKEGKRASFKHLTLYPLHMFWAIFVGNRGYKDSVWGFLLAACFAYYEFIRYFFLFRRQKK